MTIQEAFVELERLMEENKDVLKRLKNDNIDYTERFIQELNNRDKK